MEECIPPQSVIKHGPYVGKMIQVLMLGAGKISISRCRMFMSSLDIHYSVADNELRECIKFLNSIAQSPPKPALLKFTSVDDTRLHNLMSFLIESGSAPSLANLKLLMLCANISYDVENIKEIYTKYVCSGKLALISKYKRRVK